MYVQSFLSRRVKFCLIIDSDTWLESLNRMDGDGLKTVQFKTVSDDEFLRTATYRSLISFKTNFTAFVLLFKKSPTMCDFKNILTGFLSDLILMGSRAISLKSIKMFQIKIFSQKIGAKQLKLMNYV